MDLESYLTSVEHRSTHKVSPLESQDYETLQLSASFFQGKHGPFDSVVVETADAYGWRLAGKRYGQKDIYTFIPRPLTARKID